MRSQRNRAKEIARNKVVERRMKVERLGQYNAEVASGLVHTPEWKREMAKLQEWFDGEFKVNREYGG